MNLVNLTPHVLHVHAADGTVMGAVDGLPEPQPDTLLIVSALVRLAVPHRTDVVSSGSLVRDESGRPVGCLGLSVN